MIEPSFESLVALRRERDLLVATLVSPALTSYEATTVGDGIYDAMNDRAEDLMTVIIDLERTVTFNSSALAMLVTLHIHAMQRGVKMLLAKPSPFLCEVLQKVRLDSVFYICKDDSELRSILGGG